MSAWVMLAALVGADTWPLEADPCVGPLAAAVSRALAVELHNRSREPRDPDMPRVAIACSGEETYTLRSRRDSARPTVRLIDVSSTPPSGRARLLALAAAELIAGPGIQASPGEVVLAETRPSVPRFLVAGVVELGRSPQSRGWVAGGGVALSHLFSRHLLTSFDLVLHRSVRQLRLGDGTLEALSARLALGPRYVLGPIEFAAAGGARVGLARISGDPRTPEARGSSSSGWWGGPTIAAGLDAHLFGTLWLLARAEAVLLLGTVVGREDGAVALGLAGSWTTLRLGLGGRF